MPKKVQWNHSFVRPGVRPTGPGWEACNIDPVVLDIPDFEEHTAHIQIFSREVGLALLAKLIDQLPALHYQRAVRGLLRAQIPELSTTWDVLFYREREKKKVLEALKEAVWGSQDSLADLGIPIEIVEIPTSVQPPKALLTFEYAGFDKYRFVFSDATVSKCFGCVHCGDQLMHELENMGVTVSDDVHDRLLVEMMAEGMQLDCQDPNPDNLDPKRNAQQLASEIREARRMDKATSFQGQRHGDRTDHLNDGLEQLGLSPEDAQRMRDVLNAIQPGKDSHPDGWPSHIIVDPFDGTRNFTRRPRLRRPKPNDRNSLRDDPED